MIFAVFPSVTTAPLHYLLNFSVFFYINPVCNWPEFTDFIKTSHFSRPAQICRFRAKTSRRENNGDELSHNRDAVAVAVVVANGNQHDVT